MISFNPLCANNFDPDKVKWPLVATPKYDGVRAMHQSKGLLTRSRKFIPNDHIRASFEETETPLGLDGELIVPGGFQATQSAVMSQHGQPDFTYHIFDYFHEGTYTERINALLKLDLPSFCRVVPMRLINDMADLKAYEEEVLEQELEGLVLRNPQGPYKQGRSTPRENYLARYTREFRDEAIVLGVNQRYKNDNAQYLDERGYAKRSSHAENLVPEDAMGSLQLRMSGIEFKVGTGFSHALAHEIWKNKSEFIGRKCTIKYKGWGSKGKPRQPVFLGWRYD
jgi:DNA ligase-1